MDNTSERKPRLFRWALWWGLGIMAVTLAVLIGEGLVADTPGFASDSMTAPMMNSIYRFVYRFGLWPVFLFIALVAPVYEELSFRLWGNGKQWAGITSVVLITIMTALTAWWAALPALLIGVFIVTRLRKERERLLLAMMIYSSVMFMVLHIGNYDASQGWFQFAMALLHKFGMGLVASYLVINHNILWSMAFHAINNSIVALIFLVVLHAESDTITSVSDDDCIVEIHPVLVEGDEQDDFYIGWESDSVFCNIDSPGNVAHLLNAAAHLEDPSISCTYDWTEYPKTEIKVTMLNGSRDYTHAVRLMEEQGWIALDTVTHQDSIYTITVGDSVYRHPLERTIHIRTTYSPLSDL